MSRRRGDSVVDIDKTVLREVWVEGYAEQPALARRVNVEGCKWFVKKLAVLDDTQPSVLLADEQTPVGRERHRSRARQTFGHAPLRKALGQRGRARRRGAHKAD